VRLLDLVAQGAHPPAGLPDCWPFPQACNFSEQVRACPLRLVMSDDLTACATQMAYADGDRLAGCMDLLHVPTSRLWVEWTDASRRAALKNMPDFGAIACAGSWKRAGILFNAQRSGRSGTIRTFWSTHRDEVVTCPLIAQFDFDRDVRPPLDVAAMFLGGTVGVMTEEAAIDELLSHISYQFDPVWGAYYRAGRLTYAHQCEVLRSALSGCAFDLPMLCALFLLYNARDGLSKSAADIHRLNLERGRRGKPGLLDHVEVRAPLQAPMYRPSTTKLPRARRSPRLHHVRGHIARRGNQVIWKSPCLRGNSGYGVVRSRSVELHLR
jgi:hypothetical protein